ncbi:nucleotide-binding domain-containing protein [Trichoderma novae-zelandiae]
MKLLVTTSLPSFPSEANVSAYTHACDAKSDLSPQLASPEAVDVWICDGPEATNDLVSLWLDQASHIPKSMLVRDTGSIARLQEYANGRVAEIKGFPEQKGTAKEWEDSILREAELLYAGARANAGVHKSNATDHENKKSVLLVGAGIVNLITALFLVSRGYRVRIVDAGPSPQLCEDWTQLGVTNGGGNARMFTQTEADNYNEKGSKLYQNMQSIFRKTARNGGWSVKPPTDFTAAELGWVNTFEQVPAWLALAFRENIHRINQEAGKLWNELIETTPQLFQDVEFRKDILRLYVEPTALDAAIKLHNKLGAMVHATTPEEFLLANPGFRSAAESDHLAGGITVDGFTVNIHPFIAKLIDHITELGGEFVWDCEVQSIERNAVGEVTAVESQLGSLEADHIVVSPGVTGNALLTGTASESLIQGVLGIWLQIPNLHPQLQHSMKIHRRHHLVEDINVTVAKDAQTGEDILMFGGGYGFVGLDRPAHDSPELRALFDELEKVASIYFPQGYAAAKERGTLYPGGHRKFCVRPFTATGLGVFEKIPTASGGQLIITGGNNTGGFAQAPAIARAVWRSLVGEHDPMHVLFHPDRGRLPVARRYKSRFPEPLSLRGLEVRQPLRVLVLCSDSPQHSYLRYRLDQAFPGYRCILETNEGQIRQLVERRRLIDACYMKYHGLRRHYFGHDHQRKAYFDRLVPRDHVFTSPDITVDSVNCREVWDAVEQWKPELTIVSGTKFIGRKLNKVGGLMINLHIGHLPEYKGNHCIFFALYDGAVDKVSATLHQLTPHLDGGDVLDTVSPPILPGDSEETLYARSVHMAIDRCIRHVEQFSLGKRLEFTPQTATGRTFRHRDRTPAKELLLWWQMNVRGLLLDQNVNKAKVE